MKPLKNKIWSWQHDSLEHKIHSQCVNNHVALKNTFFIRVSETCPLNAFDYEEDISEFAESIFDEIYNILND